MILDDTVEVRTSKGIVSMTNFEVIFRSLVAHAAKGQPTSLIQFMKILPPALEGEFCRRLTLCSTERK